LYVPSLRLLNSRDRQPVLELVQHPAQSEGFAAWREVAFAFGFDLP
jgi:hypothetical protein